MYILKMAVQAARLGERFDTLVAVISTNFEVFTHMYD